jgi:hypothetical protein
MEGDSGHELAPELAAAAAQAEPAEPADKGDVAEMRLKLGDIESLLGEGSIKVAGCPLFCVSGRSQALAGFRLVGLGPGHGQTAV